MGSNQVLRAGELRQQGKEEGVIVVHFELPPKLAEKIRRGPIIFIAALERENLDRMREADPLYFHFAELKGPSRNAPLRHLDLVIAYEEDVAALLKFKKEKNIAEFLNWLERGRKIKPGDITPPISLKESYGRSN
jgi:hypothetical protein